MELPFLFIKYFGTKMFDRCSELSLHRSPLIGVQPHFLISQSQVLYSLEARVPSVVFKILSFYM